MSMSFTVAQLEAQKQVTQQAYAAGQINQAGYNQWMAEQNRLIAEAKAREAQAKQQAPPATPAPGTQFTEQQILEQNKVFEQAYRTGQISQAEYNTAMTVQNQNLNQAQQKAVQNEASTLMADYHTDLAAVKASEAAAQTAINTYNTLAQEYYYGNPGGVPNITYNSVKAAEDFANTSIATYNSNLAAFNTKIDAVYQPMSSSLNQRYSDLVDKGKGFDAERAKSNPFTLDVWEQQNKGFLDAHSRGEISDAELSRALDYQAASLPNVLINTANANAPAGVTTANHTFTNLPDGGLELTSYDFVPVSGSANVPVGPTGNDFWTNVSLGSSTDLAVKAYENREPIEGAVAERSMVGKVQDFFGWNSGEGVFSALKKGSFVTPKLQFSPVYAAATGNLQENRFTSFAAGVEYAPSSQLMTSYEMKALANNLVLVGAVATIPVSAPMTTLKMVGVGVGLAQAAKTGMYGYEQYVKGTEGVSVRDSLLSPSEAFYAAGSSVIFVGANQFISGAVGGVGSPVGRELLRAGGNAVLGGGVAGAVELGVTGDVSAGNVAKGAIIAGGLSLGISGLRAATPYFPSRGKGIQFTPFEDPVTGKSGLRIEGGVFKIPAQRSIFGGMSDALPTPVKGLTRTMFVYGDKPPSTFGVLLGRGNMPAPQNAVIQYSTGSYQAGFQPSSLMQTGSTVRAMQSFGYGNAEIGLVKDLRGLAAPVQGVKVNPSQASLPSETLTLNTGGMTLFKELVRKTPGVTLFGSAVLQPQLSKSGSYVVPDANKGGKLEVSGRLPMDVDVQFKGSPAEANKFVADILEIGKRTGNPLSVDPENPYMIMGVNRETGNPAHAFDIKVSGLEPAVGVGDSVSDGGLKWGFETSKPSVKIEGMQAQRLDEQINRLAFDSTLRFHADKTMGPADHRRAKDTIRTMHALETAYAVKGVDITVDPRFTRTLEYFGITREAYAAAPKPVEYVLDSGLVPVSSDGGLTGSGGGSTGGSDGGSSASSVVRVRRGSGGSLASFFLDGSSSPSASRVGGRGGSGSGKGSIVGSGRGSSVPSADVSSPVLIDSPSNTPSLELSVPGITPAFSGYVDVPSLTGYPPVEPPSYSSPYPSPYRGGTPPYVPTVPSSIPDFGSSVLHLGRVGGNMHDREPNRRDRKVRSESGKRQKRAYYVASPEKMLANFAKGGNLFGNSAIVKGKKRVGKSVKGKGKRGKR